MTSSTRDQDDAIDAPRTLELDADGLPLHPTDILLHLIAAFLTPMFMGACSGHLGYARLAALETMASYRTRTQAELVAVAQIIAYGLVAMDSLCLSMGEMPLSMKLRLRGCANALNRSAQQNMRAMDMLRRGITQPGRHAAVAEPAVALTVDDISETDARAAVAKAQAVIEQAKGRMRVASDAAQRVATRAAAADQAEFTAAALRMAAGGTAGREQPAVRKTADGPVAGAGTGAAQPAAAAALTAEQRNNMIWASAMTDVAGELPVDSSIPPLLRRSNRVWAQALGSAASHLAMRAAGALQTPGPAAVKQPGRA